MTNEERCCVYTGLAPSSAGPWPMCLLSPLIIIPIEVTPETAGTWETHFTLSHPQCLQSSL